MRSYSINFKLYNKYDLHEITMNHNPLDDSLMTALAEIGRSRPLYIQAAQGVEKSGCVVQVDVTISNRNIGSSICTK